MTSAIETRREDLRSELEAARREFYDMVASISEPWWAKPSRNPGWMNGQLLFHVFLGFILVLPLAGILLFFGHLPAVCSRMFAAVLNFSTPPSTGLTRWGLAPEPVCLAGRASSALPDPFGTRASRRPCTWRTSSASPRPVADRPMRICQARRPARTPGVPCRYEPGLQRTYEEFARYAGTVVLPARPRKPRDKAKAEAGVLVATRWILARLRHERFFSLAALNARIAELLESLNTRPMRLYRASRRELFERLDRPALRPLPAEAFIVGEWHYETRVNIDYHVELHGHYYSVPYELMHERVDARLTVTTVELFHRGQRVAAHVRSQVRGRHTTDPAHMPKAHQRHLEWTPSRFITWASTIGPQTAALVEAILADRPHPEQGYRSCLGILRLAKRDGDTRLEAACARAVAVGARSYRHVDSILKHGLDRLPGPMASSPLPLMPVHEQIRGREYYRDPAAAAGEQAR
jgi:transposase